MAMVVPGLIPSFWTSGFPEYPAIFAALAACRLLPPVAALVHHPPDPPGRVVGAVQGAVRRPMPRKRDQRLLLVLAASDRLAVAPILGREHQVTQLGVVVAIRPAVVVPLRKLEELFRGLFRALLQREQLGPVLAQLIAAVLGRVQLA